MPRIDLEDPQPTRFQKLQVISMGHVRVGKHSKPGWSGAIEFYLFLCKKHGYVTNYPQGHAQNLFCPKCREETKT